MARQAMSIRWEIPPSELAKAIEKYGDKFMKALYAFAQRSGIEIQNEMRIFAPWTDRTGQARGNLFGIAERPRHKKWLVRIYAFQGVPYGVFLELRYGGRYAIIMPTLQRLGPQIIKDVQGLLKD
jgi:hypothetical protein